MKVVISNGVFEDIPLGFLPWPYQGGFVSVYWECPSYGMMVRSIKFVGSNFPVMKGDHTFGKSDVNERFKNLATSKGMKGGGCTSVLDMETVLKNELFEDLSPVICVSTKEFRVGITVEGQESGILFLFRIANQFCEPLLHNRFVRVKVAAGHQNLTSNRVKQESSTIRVRKLGQIHMRKTTRKVDSCAWPTFHRDVRNADMVAGDPRDSVEMSTRFSEQTDSRIFSNDTIEFNRR